MKTLSLRAINIALMLTMLLAPFTASVSATPVSIPASPALDDPASSVLPAWAQPPALGNNEDRPAAPAGPDDPLDKVEPLVLNELTATGQTDFFVWMAEKADLSPAYELKTKEEKGRFVFEALRETAKRTQRTLRAHLDQQGVDYRPFHIANKILVRGGNQTLLLNIASRPDVARITANHKYQLEEPIINPNPPAHILAMEPNIGFVNADDVWAMGYTGEGTVMAGNDTGLDWDHPALINQYRGWNGATADHNYNWWDATGTYPIVPGDGAGHGTHTSGTMVGDDGGSNQIGVAPGAQTIHCKNMTDSGSGSDATFTECFEWDLAPWDLNGLSPRPDLAPDAINNSWGYWGGGDPQFEDEIAALQAAGIVVEVSAGNEGPSCGTLRSPSDYRQSLTTGSVDHSGGSLPGALTGFSSRGPSSLYPTDYIPDVMAPGENIRSSVPGGGYQGGWSGTSMSGPHVTALIGLMWSANPGLRGMVTETVNIILDTAVPLTGQGGSGCGGDYTEGPNNDWGYGTIDALAAVEQAMLFGGTGTLAGTVTDGLLLAIVPDATIRATLSPTLSWQTTSGALGNYSMVVFSGTYTVDAYKYGHIPDRITGVSVISGTTTTLNITLPPAAYYLVSGSVTDSGTGDGLWATINIAGDPVDPPTTTVQTDRVTGYYSLTLAGGITYTFDVAAPLHNNMIRTVGPLTGATTENFALTATTTDGVLAGWVRNKYTGDPIQNATVQVEGGPSATTDAEGYYQTTTVSPGFYTATASANLYSSVAITDIEVRQSNIGWADFDLPTPGIEVSPTALSYTLELGQQFTQTPGLVISNTGEGGLNFELWERKGGFQSTSLATGPFADVKPLVPPEYQEAATTEGLDLPPAPAGTILAAGDVIQSWPSGLVAAWGIAYSSDDRVWVGLGWNPTNTVYEYLPDGTPTGISHPYTWGPSSGPADSAFNWNTGMVWTLDVGSDDCIHEMDPSTGYTGNTICGPWTTSQRGVAYDPDTDTWYVGGWNEGVVYHIDSSGALLDSANVGLSISGLAYNPETQHLFVQINGGTVDVYVLDASLPGVYPQIGQFHIGALTGGAGLEIDCEGNLWAVDQSNEMVYQAESGESASLCAQDTVPWFAEDPIAGAIAPSSSLGIDIGWWANVAEVDQPGDYYAGLKIKNNDPANQNLVLPVTMTVTPPSTWGKLMGIVSSTGHCDVNPHPIEGAQIYLEGSSGYTCTLETDAGGIYQRWLDSTESPYTVTVSSPEHPTTAASVVIVAGATTTQSFALRWQQPCVSVTVPPAGISATLDMGLNATFPMSISNSGAAALEFEIAERDAGFTPLAGGNILLVDDDSGGSYDARPYFEAALTSLGVSYDVFDTGGGDGPSAAQMAGYATVIWFSGDTFGGTAGPNSTDETNLATYLDGGGSLFLTSQDYYYDMGLTPFMQMYLGLDSATSDVGHTSVTGVPGDPIGGGFGTLSLSYPGFNYSDNLTPDGTASATFSGSAGDYAAIDKGDGYQTVFLGFPWEALQNSNPLDGEAVMQAILDWLTPADVPWLFEDPITGTVPSDGGLAPIDVTLDAAHVAQPGEYYATLSVKNNDPVNSRVGVPVTMTVNVPSTWGKLTVVISSTGHCDVNPAPLEGAEVLVENGTTVSVTTDVSGTYAYWLDQGTYTVTISADEHISDTAVVNVTAQATTTHNVALRWLQPCVSVAPASISVTLDMALSTTLPMSISNNGAATAAFELQEEDRGFEIATLSAVQIPGYQAPELEAEEAYASQHLVSRESWSYHPSTDAFISSIPADVLLVAAADATQIQAMLQAYPDINLVDYFDARLGTPTLAQLLAYDTAIVLANQSFASPVAMGDVLADYVDAGGTVIQTVATFYDPFGNSWGLQGRFVDEGYSPFIGTGDWFSWADLGAFDPTHPIMQGVTAAGDDLRQVVDLSADADLVAEWTDDEFVATKGSVVALNTFLPDGYDWTGDVDLIVHNSVIWLQTGGDTPWLSEDPITGTVPADGGLVPIDVTLDAAYVAQPGEYYATLNVKSDDPVNSRIGIPVTMTVNLPATYGKLQGTVTSLGYCDVNTTTLEGAQVQIEGHPLTLTTDVSGTYVLWLDQGIYTVTTSYAEHLTATTEVIITAQTTTTQDFVLRWLQPCVSVAPPSISATLDMGLSTTLPMSISNSGAVTATFDLQETDSGFSPLMLTLVTVPPSHSPVGTDSAAAANAPLGHPTGGTYYEPNLLAAGLTDVLLVFADDGNGEPLYTILDIYPDIGIVGTLDARYSTPILADLLPYDVVIAWNNYPYADSTALGDVLADYVDSGGKVILTAFNWQWIEFGLGGRLMDEFYSPFLNLDAGNHYSWANLGTYDTGHSIMQGVTAASDYYRDIVDLDPGAYLVASWNDGEEFIATKGSVVAINSYSGYYYAWTGDIGIIFHNAVNYLMAGGNVPWLSEDPITGTVPTDGGLALIDVTLDAARVTQPGEYYATLNVKSNDSVNDRIGIPVTMTVEPDPDMGKLHGTVTADRPTGPLEGALVEVISGTTTVISGTTDGSGGYGPWWLTNGVYSITVSAMGYFPDQQTVTITAGMTTTHDVMLLSSYVLGAVAYVTLSDSNLVALVDTASHTVMGTVNVGAAGCDFPWRATMSPAGDYVYVGCYNSDNVAVIETAGNTVVATVGGINAADGIAFTRDGAYALVGSRWSSQIAVVDTTTYAVTTFIPTPDEARSVVTHPYLDRAYATCANGTIQVIDTTDFGIVEAISVGGEPWDVVISPDGRWVFTGDRWGGGLTVIAAGSNTLYTTVTGLGSLTGLEVAPDGSKIYASSLSNGVRVIDGVTFNLITTISGLGNAWEAAVTCDGSELYVGNTGNQVPVIDTAATALTDTIDMPGSGSRGIAICPQARLPGLYLYPTAQSGYETPGESVVYDEFLVNATGQTDSFDLSLAGNTWDTGLSLANTGPLSDGDWISFTAQVTIPVSASAGDGDTALIQATSVASPTVYSDTATIATTALCTPNLTFAGQSAWAGSLDDTYDYGEQLFTRVYLYAHTTSGGNSIVATVSGYNAGNGMWEIIGEWWYVGSQLLVDGWYLPPVYSQIRVELRDNWGAQVYYGYQFIICRETAVDLSPPSQQSFAQAGTTAIYTQTVTNYMMATDSFDLSASGNSWPTTLWDGTTPVSNTGPLADLETFTFTVKVEIPASASIGDSDAATIRARSVASPAISDTASLRTTVLAYPWVQAFSDEWAPDSSTDRDQYLDIVRSSGIVTAQVTDDWDWQNGPPAVAAYPREAIVAAWTSPQHWNGMAWYCNVEYAAHDADGNTVIPVTQVSDNISATVYTYDYNPAPAVAPTDGNVLIAWYRYESGSVYNIYYAVRGPAGTEVLSPTALTTNITSTVRDYYPSAAAFDDGRFAVVWQHRDDATGANDIYYAVLNSAGGLIVGPVNLTNNVWEDDYEPRANRLADGNILLTWHGYHGSGREIYYAVLDSAGNVVHPVTRLTDMPDSAYNPDAVGLRNGNAVVSWEQYGYYAGQWGRQIAYTVLDSAYTPTTTVTILTNTLSNDNRYVSLARDGDDNGVLTWRDDDRQRIYYALVDNSGAVRTWPLVFRTARGRQLDISWWGAGNGSLPGPLLTLDKAAAPDPVTAGGTLVYTLTYGNAGSSPISGIVLTETYDANVTFVAADPPPDAGNNVWNIGDLPNGVIGTVVITVEIASPLPNGTLLHNQAILDALDTEAAVASADTVVTSAPIWTLLKSDTPDPIEAGRLLVYTIAYGNSGNEDATGVVITETYDANATFVTANPAPTGGDNAWTIGPVSVGFSDTIVVTVEVASPLPGGTLLTNRVALDSDQSGPVEHSITTTVTSAPVWLLTKSDNLDPVAEGSTLVYTVTYGNVGNENVTGVSLVETYPSQVTFVAADPPPSLGNAVWSIGTLYASVTDTVVITVEVDTPLPNGTVMTNIVTIASNEIASLSVDETTLVHIPTPVLSIIKTDTPDPVKTGGLLTYTIVVQNTGDADATGVTISDTIPANTTFASADSGGSLASDQVRWTGKMVNASSSLTVTFAVQVSGSLPDESIIANSDYGVKCIQVPTPVMGAAITTTVTVEGWQVYLPVVMRNHTPGG